MFCIVFSGKITKTKNKKKEKNKKNGLVVLIIITLKSFKTKGSLNEKTDIFKHSH